VQPIAAGIQGLPDGTRLDFDWLKTNLLACYDLTKNSAEHSNVQSQVYRAACRIDELEFETEARRK
jgi:hypothetical protein